MRFGGTNRQREPEPPRGVRILHGDGSVSECAVARDPEDGPGRIARWIAVPPEGRVFADGDTLHVDVLPPRTSVGLSLTARAL
jgi:hypothetical protein